MYNNNFKIVSSDCDLELLCDDAQFDSFKYAVNHAINDMVAIYEDSCNNACIPQQLHLYISRKDDVIQLRTSDRSFTLTEQLSLYLPLNKN